jgi:hypothetical protein
MAGRGMAPPHAADGNERDASPNGCRRDESGDQDPSRMAELATNGIADRSGQLRKRPTPGQACSQASLEPGAGGEGPER